MKEASRGRFQGRVAIVTGAGSGIGLEISRQLLDEGARLAAIDWQPERVLSGLEEVLHREEVRDNTIVLTGDVTKETDIRRCVAEVVAKFGHVHLLVNSAGIVDGDDVLSIERETWDRNLESVLTSVYLCCRSVIPAMLVAGHGSIVNIASVNGLRAFGDDAYSAAKAGVISLTQSIAVRYGSAGIRCNAVAPADIRTPRWEPRLREDPELLDRLARWYPLGRIGEPEDIAHAALFLGSDDASWVTGTTLVVDGGLLAGSRAMMEAMYPER